MLSMQQVLDIGTKMGVDRDRDIKGAIKFQLKYPLINLTKAQIIRRGIDLGVDYSMSVSCYRANTDLAACGECDSCVYRRQGFLDSGVDDAPVYY